MHKSTTVYLLKQCPSCCVLENEVNATKTLKGKATLKENIIKMKDILFPNILVQVS